MIFVVNVLIFSIKSYVLKRCINYTELVVIEGTLHCMFTGCYWEVTSGRWQQ
jgi:hypothetical protein